MNSFSYPVAARLLYRELTVSSSPMHVPPSIMLTLAKRPDLARHVRCFAVALDQSGTEFHSFLAAALSAMTSLVSLDIFIDADSWVLPNSLVYAQLQHFACSFPLDSRVAAFLHNAPGLESVQIDSAAPQSPSLFHASLPRLAEFTGCASAAAAVVPGRPVESIHINSGDLTEDLVPALAQSTALVTVLSITTSSAPLPLLEVLGQHLPHIMYLRITSTSNLPAPPTTIFYEQVAEALAFFPNLQSFELSGMYWSSSKQPDDRRQWSQPLLNTTNNELGPQDEVLDLYSNAADFFFS
ncbi:F-box domain-containing protein [Mycena venus]|uniref:F-box domain-containing protein n=1 Tax=Mycena venus TaxID=2733690 RepID=A0A8H6Y6B7_9AGAR|nr:F-box domain-containing protein [Mycena venus]